MLVLANQKIYLDNILSTHYFNSVFFEPYQMITHMFMHSKEDFFHILFNMLILVMFGGHLERVWGAKKFFIFYFACGIGALVLYNSIGVWQIMELKPILEATGNSIGDIDYLIREDKLFLTRAASDFNVLVESNIHFGNLNSGILSEMSALKKYVGLNYSSMLGASGALFGVLAGFGVLFPNTQLMLLFPPIPIKAKYLIGGYLAFEVYNSLTQPHDQVAHLAHVGGAIVGIIFILVWRKRDRKNFW
jgi:membrane associated rhomboid family serine protease